MLFDRIIALLDLIFDTDDIVLPSGETFQQELDTALIESIMRRMETEIRQRVLDRTARGEDFMGRPFVAYSQKYADYKRKTTGTDVVNLRLSGEMLDDFYVRCELNEQAEIPSDVFSIHLEHIVIFYGFHSDLSIYKYF